MEEEEEDVEGVGVELEDLLGDGGVGEGVCIISKPFLSSFSSLARTRERDSVIFRVSFGCRKESGR